MELVLRDYQIDIVDKTRNALKDGFKAPLIVLPCGAGKTAVFAWMASQSQANGKIVWFLVHRQELLNQTEETFKKFDIPTDKILIGMVQTVANHLEKYPKPDIIVFDEAHFSAAKTWGKIIEAYPEAYRIGLTATPCRLDGKPLGEIYDKMIVGISTEELIETGKLSKYKYMSVPLINTKKMRTTAGDYNIADIEKEFKPTVYADVIKTYKQQADGKKSICYCPTIEISERTAEEFNQAGIHAVHFDGTTPKKQREQIISDFRAGEIKILCNVDLISVGFDVPDCECCILLRPTQSVALFIQQSMRALRPLPGKVAVILDHVANYQRHGLPDMARDWSLDKKIDKKGVQKVVETIIVTCENCYQVYEKTKGKTEPCPFCGFITEKQQRQMDYEKQIELQEITKTEKIKAWWQCKSMDELHEVAKQKGYKPGWAWLKGKELGFWKPKNWIAKEI